MKINENLSLHLLYSRHNGELVSLTGRWKIVNNSRLEIECVTRRLRTDYEYGWFSLREVKSYPVKTVFINSRELTFTEEYINVCSCSTQA